MAFFSDATNLHPADTDLGADVFVKNVRTGELILASQALWHEGQRRQPRPGDLATNLHPARVPGVYVKDLRTGAVLLASSTATGVPPTPAPTVWRCRPTGRAWRSPRPPRTCTPKDPVDDFDVYVKDLVTGGLVLASLSASGARRVGVFGSLGAGLSADGRRVGFTPTRPACTRATPTRRPTCSCVIF